MKINSLNCIQSQNFGSTPLYKAKIRQRLLENFESSPCDVYITRLDRSDLQRLKREEKDWEDTRYGSKIIDAFEMQNPEADRRADMETTFYAIETPNPRGERQIRALAMITNYFKEKRVELDWLQTNNDLCMPTILNGAGSCLMFMAVKHARKKGANTFSVYSNTSALDFYKKFKLNRKQSNYNEFTLDNRNFDRITDRIRKKYSIEPAGLGR